MKRLVPVLALVGLVACGGNSPTDSNGSGELVIQDLVIGGGATAVNGDTVTVHYLGTFTNGTKFESSYDTGTPLTPFRLGTNAVIPGFEQTILGMKVGGKRRATVPPNLAYGSQGRNNIPPNTTLVFEIELLSIAGK